MSYVSVAQKRAQLFKKFVGFQKEALSAAIQAADANAYSDALLYFYNFSKHNELVRKQDEQNASKLLLFRIQAAADAKQSLEASKTSKNLRQRQLMLATVLIETVAQLRSSACMQTRCITNVQPFNNFVKSVASKKVLVSHEPLYKFSSIKKNTSIVLHLDSSRFNTEQLVSDLEHLFGAHVFVQIRALSTVGSLDLFKRAFCHAFSSVTELSEYDSLHLYNILYFFGATRDARFLTSSLIDILNSTPFPAMDSLFSSMKEAVSFFWYYWTKKIGARGMYLALSGKLSRHLLTISRTSKLRLGKTAAGLVGYGALTDFGCYTSETGAYGLFLNYFFVSDLISKKRARNLIIKKQQSAPIKACRRRWSIFRMRGHLYGYYIRRGVIQAPIKPTRRRQFYLYNRKYLKQVVPQICCRAYTIYFYFYLV